MPGTGDDSRTALIFPDICIGAHTSSRWTSATRSDRVLADGHRRRPGRNRTNRQGNRRRYRHGGRRVRNLDGVRTVYDAGVAPFGKVDIGLPNVGIMPVIRVRQSAQAWHDVMLTGVWHTLESTVPGLIERGQGDSIITTSAVGFTSIRLNTSPGRRYSAANHYVVGLVRLYVRQLARIVSVNTVHPTGVTPRWRPTRSTPNSSHHAEVVADESYKNPMTVEMVESVDISKSISATRSCTSGPTMPRYVIWNHLPGRRRLQHPLN
ncbi:SDR family NAD(P)-dependent oxidoreductase [Rhodococcus sp. 5G237]